MLIRFQRFQRSAGIYTFLSHYVLSALCHIINADQVCLSHLQRGDRAHPPAVVSRMHLIFEPHFPAMARRQRKLFLARLRTDRVTFCRFPELALCIPMFQTTERFRTNSGLGLLIRVDAVLIKRWHCNTSQVLLVIQPCVCGRLDKTVDEMWCGTEGLVGRRIQIKPK